ncbi:MAG TPA: hypothetical protein PLM75_04615 [bacterium]|nr:hypothetical protein [bacterium]HPP87126.1 hypothetical protein [bacterium]
MLEDKNQTTRLYNKQKSREIFDRIKDEYINIFEKTIEFKKMKKSKFPEIKIKRTFEEAFKVNKQKLKFLNELRKENLIIQHCVKDFIDKDKKDNHGRKKGI